MTFGARVKKWRTHRGLTQEFVAKEVGVTKAAISAIERGDTKNMRPDHLFKLADVLQCSARQLVFGRDRDEDLLLGDDTGSITGEYESLLEADKKIVHSLIQNLSDRHKPSPSPGIKKIDKK